MFVYQFVDRDLRVDTFFEKDGGAENGGVDFEKGGLGTFLQYWRLKKLHTNVWRKFQANSEKKLSRPVLSSLHYWVQNRGKDTH